MIELYKFYATFYSQSANVISAFLLTSIALFIFYIVSKKYKKINFNKKSTLLSTIMTLSIAPIAFNLLKLNQNVRVQTITSQINQNEIIDFTIFGAITTTIALILFKSLKQPWFELLNKQIHVKIKALQIFTTNIAALFVIATFIKSQFPLKNNYHASIILAETLVGAIVLYNIYLYNKVINHKYKPN